MNIRAHARAILASAMLCASMAAELVALQPADELVRRFAVYQRGSEDGDAVVVDRFDAATEALASREFRVERPQGGWRELRSGIAWPGRPFALAIERAAPGASWAVRAELLDAGGPPTAPLALTLSDDARAFLAHGGTG